MNIYRNSFPFYPFLFAFLPFLVLFIGNINQLYPLELVLPVLSVFIPIILLLFGFTFFFKNLNKSGLFVSLIIILFFSYGFMFTKINEMMTPFQISHEIFLIPFFIIGTLGFLYCLKTKHKLNNIATILNAITITLIIVLSSQLVTYDFNTNYIFEDGINGSTEFNLTDELDKYPDIYYIILDEYAGERTLEDTFDYDNDEFINFLNDNGFHTPQDTQSNYVLSFLSLSSSLNMQYVNFYADEVGIDSKDRRLSYNLLHNNRLMQILESNGYLTINFDSRWGPTNKLEIANQNRCEQNSFLSDLYIMTISNSMLKPIYADIFLPNDRERVLCIFSELPEIQFTTQKPLFVFAHIMLPHGPYVWGPNGEHKKIESLNMLTIEADKQGYVDQLTFTNKMVQKMIEEILDDDERPKVIIIQSDHGAAYPMDWDNPTDKMMYDRLSNINYILLPDKKENILYDDITPVNLFRVLFNAYFNTDFKILEDKIFFSNYNKPYNFTDITYIFRDI